MSEIQDVSENINDNVTECFRGGRGGGGRGGGFGGARGGGGFSGGRARGGSFGGGGRSRSGSPNRGTGRSGSPPRGTERSGSPPRGTERSGSPRYFGNYNKNVKATRGAGTITPRQPANRYGTTATINNNVRDNIPPLYPITQAKSPQSTGGYLNDKNYIKNPQKLSKAYYPAQQLQTPVAVKDGAYARRRWAGGRRPWYRRRPATYNTYNYTSTTPYPYYNPYYWFFPYTAAATTQPSVTNIYPVTTSDSDGNDGEQNIQQSEMQMTTGYDDFNYELLFIYLFGIIILLLILVMVKN